MRLHFIFILTLLAAVVTSCSLDDVIDKPNDGALRFSAVPENAITRGIPVANAANIPSMQVYAYYTGNGSTADKKWSATSTPNWLDGAVVTNSGVGTGTASWSYPTPVYWPRETDANMSFFGFSPAAVAGATGNGITVTNTTGTPLLHYATPHTATLQPDLMVAPPHIDLQQAGNSTITFGMKHALTAIGFKVASANENFDLTGITVVGVNTTGDLSADGNTVAWTNVQTPDTAAVGLTSNPYAVTTTAANCTADNGYLMMIPQTLTATAKLKIYIAGLTQALEVSLDGKAWEAGKKIIYTMTIGKEMQVDLQVGEQPWDDPYNAAGNIGAGQLPWTSSMAFTISTTAAGETFTLPFSGANGTGTVTVNWGDNTTPTTIDPGTIPGTLSHSYTTAGSHTIRISTTQTDTQTKQIPMLPFKNKSQLKSVNTPLLNMGTTDLTDIFNGCSSLTTIPAGLFKYNTQVTDFTRCFIDCMGLTTIPADLFKYNTQVTNFTACFSDCTGLTTIPADLFKYNTQVTDFTRCFFNCTGLTAIPADLFKYNTNVTDFTFAFYQCSGLSAIPADLFRYNTAVKTFDYTFADCRGLSGLIPAGLFKYNKEATSFYGCFIGDTGLKLNADIFCDEATEKSSRFSKANVNYNFAYCFRYCSGGTAPSLWNYTYGSGSTVSPTQCFFGVNGLTNAGSVPAAWIY